MYYKKQISRKLGCDKAIRIYLLEYFAHNYNLLRLLLQLFINNNKFNLLFDLVPLMGPRRLIPIVKTQYIH